MHLELYSTTHSNASLELQWKCSSLCKFIHADFSNVGTDFHSSSKVANNQLVWLIINFLHNLVCLTIEMF